MLTRLFPRTVSNDWNGLRIAVWLLLLLAVLKAMMGANVMLNGQTVAINADGIPLDTYPPDAARAAVSLFAIWGVGHLMLALLALVVVVRYRALVPLMLLAFLLEHVARKAVLLALPIVKTGAPPGGAINIAMIVVNVVALLLALYAPRARQVGSANGQ